MTMEAALSKSGVPPLDAEMLLAYALGKNRAWLLAHATDELPQNAEETFHMLCERKSRGEPTAYLTGEQEFYGLTFHVNPDVLIPRPSTEMLIDVARQTLDGKRKTLQTADTGIIAASEIFRDDTPAALVDMGTGSGCIAITLAMLFPNKEIIAVDSSPKALDVASENAKRHHADITFMEGTMLAPLLEYDRYFFVVSNPPYIPIDVPLPKAVEAFEPAQALRAGPEGMDVLGPLFAQAKKHPYCTGIALECREEQWQKLH